ncbi:MAG: outer membrane protein assembly factor BamD [Gracilimonas sp.]
MRPILLILFSFLFVFSACKNDNLIKRGDTVEVAYQKAMAFYEKGDFGEAANAFDTVSRIGRGTEYGQDAQYYLAESYYKDKQYLLAASEYDRYVSYFPQDERRQEMEFKAAMCYYHLSPRYKLDQSQTRQAIERFQLFNNRYPNSDKVTEAAERIDDLRLKLAHKSYEAAQFYVRTEQYRAATIYLDRTIDRFPETKWAEKALVDLVKAYIDYADNSVANKQAERYMKSIEAYETFLQLFPDSEHRGKVEEYHDQALKKLAGVQPNSASDNTSPR